MPPITVSQLNRYVAFKLGEDSHLQNILVKGELSGFSCHARSGHCYFTLKDSTAAIKGVMFNSFASRLAFVPENGMNVIIAASVKLYERDGSYQLYATDIQPDGLGAAYLALEQLKERMAAEGLFDQSRKKALPRFPKRIGIVTAKGGAALQDVLNILQRRYPICEAVVFGCMVQGEYAEKSVICALEDADNSGCDVVICGRGGGSAEDLWVFNSEHIARTVAAMSTPVISAVGHETDTTLIDFVSDLRAPTPSAAAELAVPEITALMSAADSRQQELERVLNQYIARKKQVLMLREERLKAHYPAAALVGMTERTKAAEERLDSALKQYLLKKENQLISRAERLDAVSPLKIMARGYGLIYSSGRLVKTAAELKTGDNITVTLSDGSREAVII